MTQPDLGRKKSPVRDHSGEGSQSFVFTFDIEFDHNPLSTGLHGLQFLITQK